jgi:hypothetical protein
MLQAIAIIITTTMWDLIVHDRKSILFSIMKKCHAKTFPCSDFVTQQK